MFNFEAFKEAWINACVHNKWVDGIPPAIYWFKDRVEIISYGGIPKGLTKEEFLSGKTQPVNKELMNIFLQYDIVEQSGHGVPLIVKEYGEKAYRFSENSITVVIPFDRIGFGKDFHEEIDGNDAIIGVDDAISDAITNENDALMGVDDAISDAITNENDNENIIIRNRIIELIKANPIITREQLAREIGKGTTTIYRIFKKLKKKGIIERVGAKRNGYWKVND